MRPASGVYPTVQVQTAVQAALRPMLLFQARQGGGGEVVEASSPDEHVHT